MTQHWLLQEGKSFNLGVRQRARTEQWIGETRGSIGQSTDCCRFSWKAGEECLWVQRCAGRQWLYPAQAVSPPPSHSHFTVLASLNNRCAPPKLDKRGLCEVIAAVKQKLSPLQQQVSPRPLWLLVSQLSRIVKSPHDQTLSYEESPINK